MAGIGKRRFKRALEETLGTKQEKLKLIPALLGAYFNGQKTITVAGRDDFVWCRIRGSTSEVVQAFNETVGAHYDLPILIYRDPNAPDIYKVYGRDIRQYDSWGGKYFSSRPHGRSHSFGGAEGNDPVWIYKRQYLPMLPRPVATGSMDIWIEPEFYYFGGQYHWWPGSGTSDLAGYKPTGSMNGRFVTVYIDGSAGIPQYLLGDEFSAIYTPKDPADYIAIPTSAQGIPIAAVFLLTGTERIGWGEIYDLRQPESPVPSTGSALQLWDDHVSQGQFGGIDLLYALAVVGETGTNAYIDVAPPVTGSFVVFDEGSLLGSALGLNVIGAQGQIVISGAYAHLMLTGSSASLPTTGSITVYDEGVLLGQADAINVVGDEVQAVLSGTTAHFMHSGIYMAPVTGSIMIADEDVLLGSVLGINFDGDNVQAVISGSWVHVMITGTAGGGGSGSVIVSDEGIVQGSAIELDFLGEGVSVGMVGTTAEVTIPGVSGSSTKRTWGGMAVHYNYSTGSSLDAGEMNFDNYSGTLVTSIKCKVTDAEANSALARLDDIARAFDTRIVVWSETDPSKWWAGSMGPSFSLIPGDSYSLSVDYIDHAGGNAPFLEGESVVLSTSYQRNQTGTVVVYEESTFLGNFKEMRFIGAGVTALDSGSYAAISIPGGGAANPPVTGSVVIFDEGVIKGSVLGLNFAGDNVEAVVSGSYAHIMVTGSAGGGNGVDVYDGNVLQKAAAAGLSFQEGNQVKVTGSIAYIEPDYAILDEYYVTGSIGQIDFTNLNQNFETLKIVLYLRSDRSDNYDGFRIQLGTGGSLDTGNNYRYIVYEKGSAATSTLSTGDSEMWIGRFDAAGANANADVHGQAEVLIPAYAHTYNHKSMQFHASVFATDAQYRFSDGWGDWENTGAIDTIRVKQEVGPNWVSGYVQIIGIGRKLN